MKKRAYLMLGIALLLAAATVLMAQKFLLSPAGKKAKPALQTTMIVVAKNRLNYGAIINLEHLRLIAWPKRAVPEGAFTSIADVVRKDERRVVLRLIEKDEPVLKSKVSGFGGRASLSAIISKNMRAATIRVNDVNGVAGFVLPGDRVDVMLTRDPASGTGRGRSRGKSGLVTDILLQNVKVLGVDQEADDSKEKPSVAKAVTLEVEPHQAQKLTLAQQVGTLSLALRNVNNSEPATTRTIRLRDLRVGEAMEEKAKEKEKPRARPTSRRTRTVVKRASSVKITRGLKASEYEVLKEPAMIHRPLTRHKTMSNPPKSNPGPDSGKSDSSSTDTHDGVGTVDTPAADRRPVPLYRPQLRSQSEQEANSGRAPRSGGSGQ